MGKPKQAPAPGYKTPFPSLSTLSLLLILSFFSLPRKVALNALHTFSSGGGGGISFAPFSPLSISRAAATAAAAAERARDSNLDRVGFFRRRGLGVLSKGEQIGGEGFKIRREANRKGERIARWCDGAGEGGGEGEGERESLLQSRKRGDVEKGQLRDGD